MALTRSRVSGSPDRLKKKEASPKKRQTAGKKTVAKAVATLAVATAPFPRGMAALTSSPYFAVSKGVTSLIRNSALSLKSPRKHSSVKKESPTRKKGVERTNAFEPMWAGKHPDLADENISVHTLILGTHPSIKSLAEQQYYGHPQNAFWWIAGDCLGFRRSSGISPSTGLPYKLSSSLRFDSDRVIPYEEQMRVFLAHGFALWDVIGSCEREGSLDSAIRNELPNDIRGFCERHPSVKRIVLANGGTGSKYFVKYNQDWWESGELRPGYNVQSKTAFGRFAKVTNNFREGRITCVSAISVSPAAAKFSYEEKRDFWETHVYRPGLQDFEARRSETNS